jgi:predicted O-methyltransferase YrrM
MMTKIKKAIKAILLILKNPWMLNKVLSNDSTWHDYLKKKYSIEHGLPLVKINAISPDFAESINHFLFLDGGSLPTDIALLKSLCRRFTDCSYFEIGTWRGESVKNLAEIAHECYTLNLSEREMSEMGLNEKFIAQYAFLSKNANNIVHLKGNSLSYDFKNLNKKFDLIFIDGDHHYDSVKNDTRKVFEHLVHDDSIVVWHDYAYTPEKYRPEVLAAILDGTPMEFKKYLYHVSNTLCAVMIKTDYPVEKLLSPLTPNITFKLELKTEKI